MSSDRDMTRIVRSWLEDGATTLPDRVLDAVLDEVPATPQRRATWWPARRFPDMNNAVRIALAAAAVVVVAFIGIRFLAPDSTGSSGPRSSPIATPLASATSTCVPVNSPAVEQPIFQGWPGSRENPPGQYSWQRGARGWMHKVDGDSAGLEMMFSASAAAYESGPTVVTVAGCDATYEVDGLRQVWIVDMDDTTFTITVTSRPTTSAADLAEAEAIVDSIRREPTEDGSLKLTFILPAGWDSG